MGTHRGFPRLIKWSDSRLDNDSGGAARDSDAMSRVFGISRNDEWPAAGVASAAPANVNRDRAVDNADELLQPAGRFPIAPASHLAKATRKYVGEVPGSLRLLPNVRWRRRLRCPASTPRSDLRCAAKTSGPALVWRWRHSGGMPCRRQAKGDRRTWVQTPRNAPVGRSAAISIAAITDSSRAIGLFLIQHGRISPRVGGVTTGADAASDAHPLPQRLRIERKRTRMNAKYAPDLLAERFPCSKRTASATPVHEGRKPCRLAVARVHLSADPTPEESMRAVLRGQLRPMELRLARADSRAAYPCPLTRRFGEAAGAVENHYPVGSVGHPYRAGPNIRCAAVGRILACSLQRLVTLGDYSLPGRFISDCICSSRQCPSNYSFPLTPCL